MWVSTDSGATWTEALVADQLFGSIATNATGNFAVTVAFGGDIWIY